MAKKRRKKLDFSIKVLTISDNSDFSIFIFFGGGVGGPNKISPHFSFSFTLISAHTNFHDPRTNPSGRKVIRRRRKKKEEKKTTNLVATSFATQPVYNAARAAHALRSDQYHLN